MIGVKEKLKDTPRFLSYNPVQVYTKEKKKKEILSAHFAHVKNGRVIRELYAGSKRLQVIISYQTLAEHSRQRAFELIILYLLYFISYERSYKISAAQAERNRHISRELLHIICKFCPESTSHCKDNIARNTHD
jgi:hypothetical protein